MFPVTYCSILIGYNKLLYRKREGSQGNRRFPALLDIRVFETLQNRRHLCL